MSSSKRVDKDAIKNIDKIKVGPQGDENHCRVCGRNDELRSVENYAPMLRDIFDVQVSDLTLKICQSCVELITHTQKFKDMIRAAFLSATSQTSSESVAEFDSVISITKAKIGRSENIFMRKATRTRKDLKNDKQNNKKALVLCTVCRQKYPMQNKVNDFVCARCKVVNTKDRTVSCVKCKAVVPAVIIKDHLEKHTKHDLKGRCRLRSLTKQPSDLKLECGARYTHKVKLQCERCHKQFILPRYLEDHMRTVHREFRLFTCHVCGKDLRSSICLEKHMKKHANFLNLELFECQFCGKIFKNVETMQKHSTLHMSRSTQ